MGNMVIKETNGSGGYRKVMGNTASKRMKMQELLL
jgi:uncharacterized circularly permuted ATP-grasp superfamily protein